MLWKVVGIIDSFFSNLKSQITRHTSFSPKSDQKNSDLKSDMTFVIIYVLSKS